MQERAMNGVEVQRSPTGGASGELGLWLSLPSLLQIPLDDQARLMLWRALLNGLSQPPGLDTPDQQHCRAALLAALTSLEPLLACRAVETGAWDDAQTLWSAALAHHQQLEARQPDAAAAQALALSDGLVQVLARLDQVLTHGQWVAPCSAAEAARLHGLACDLLQAIRGLQQPLPAWLPVVEEGLVRRGALALLEQPERRSRLQAVALLLRLAQLVDPLPEWLPARVEHTLVDLLHDLATDPDLSAGPAEAGALVTSCRQLTALVSDPQRQAAIADALERARLSLELGRQPTGDEHAEGFAADQLSGLVQQWLEDLELGNGPAAPQPITLGLVWIPGARALPHRKGGLDLNLAALVAPGPIDPLTLQQGIEAFFVPLQRATQESVPNRPRFSLQHPLASLLDSLAHLWGAGGSLNGSECSALGWAQGIWNRCGGPGALGAQQLPMPYPAACLEPGSAVVQPSAVQLAALRSWLLDRQALEQALGTLRRRHHDRALLQRCRPEQWWDPRDPLENLCRLALIEGFYEHTARPLASLAAWAEPSLAQLASAQLIVDPQQPGSALFAVLQGLFQAHGRLPMLVRQPADSALDQMLAGREVLLITHLAAQAEAFHRSGQAFNLTPGQPIAAYGLRCIAAPDSRHPLRPDQGFETSLAHCLTAVEQQARARSFDIVLSACGAYDLPLCEAIGRRYGCTTLALGPQILSRFGVRPDAPTLQQPKA